MMHHTSRIFHPEAPLLLADFTPKAAVPKYWPSSSQSTHPRPGNLRGQGNFPGISCGGNSPPPGNCLAPIVKQGDGPPAARLARATLRYAVLRCVLTIDLRHALGIEECIRRVHRVLFVPAQQQLVSVSVSSQQATAGSAGAGTRPQGIGRKTRQRRCALPDAD